MTRPSSSRKRPTVRSGMLLVGLLLTTLFVLKDARPAEANHIIFEARYENGNCVLIGGDVRLGEGMARYFETSGERMVAPCECMFGGLELESALVTPVMCGADTGRLTLTPSDRFDLNCVVPPEPIFPPEEI